MSRVWSFVSYVLMGIVLGVPVWLLYDRVEFATYSYSMAFDTLAWIRDLYICLAVVMGFVFAALLMSHVPKLDFLRSRPVRAGFVATVAAWLSTILWMKWGYPLVAEIEFFGSSMDATIENSLMIIMAAAAIVELLRPPLRLPGFLREPWTLGGSEARHREFTHGGHYPRRRIA